MKKNVIICVLVIIILILLIIVALQSIKIKNNVIVISDEQNVNYKSSGNKNEEIIEYNELMSEEEYRNMLKNNEKWSMSHVMENLISRRRVQ